MAATLPPREPTDTAKASNSGESPPDAHALIDWARGHDFLDKERRQARRESAFSILRVDLPARVTGIDAAEHGRYTHVEVMTQRNDCRPDPYRDRRAPLALRPDARQVGRPGASMRAATMI